MVNLLLLINLNCIERNTLGPVRQFQITDYSGVVLGLLIGVSGLVLRILLLAGFCVVFETKL